MLIVVFLAGALFMFEEKRHECVVDAIVLRGAHIQWILSCNTCHSVTTNYTVDLPTPQDCSYWMSVRDDDNDGFKFNRVHCNIRDCATYYGFDPHPHTHSLGGLVGRTIDCWPEENAMRITLKPAQQKRMYDELPNRDLTK